MPLVLYFKGEPIGAAQSASLSREPNPDGATERWTVDLLLAEAAARDREALLEGLKAKLDGAGDLELRSGVAPLRTLASADCRQGPAFERWSASSVSPADAHQPLRVGVVFAAVLQDAASAVQSLRSVVALTTRAGKPNLLRTEGRAILRSGESPADHEAAVIPAVPAGSRRILRETTRDAARPSLDFAVEDEEIFSPLPAGIDDGFYSISTETGDGGSSSAVTRGFFVGLGARARALELLPSPARLERWRLEENPFERRVDFEFIESLEPSAGADAFARTESLSYTTRRRIVDFPLLDPGAPAYRQEMGSPWTEVVQEGRAYGRGRHAPPPAPRYAGDVVERQVTYAVPDEQTPAAKRYETRWRYVSRLVRAVSELSPEV